MIICNAYTKKSFLPAQKINVRVLNIKKQNNITKIYIKNIQLIKQQTTAINNGFKSMELNDANYFFRIPYNMNRQPKTLHVKYMVDYETQQKLKNSKVDRDTWLWAVHGQVMQV